MISKEECEKAKNILCAYEDQLLKCNKITFSEFVREFCVKTDGDLWFYNGIRYNDMELDLVYEQYNKDLN